MYCRTDRNLIAKNFFNPRIGVVSKSSKTEYFCGGCLTFVKVHTPQIISTAALGRPKRISVRERSNLWIYFLHQIKPPMTGVKRWLQSGGLNMKGIRALSILQLYAVSYPSSITHKSVKKLRACF